MLAADAGLGVVAALLVLAQAVLIAHVAARAFSGASLRAVATLMVVLVAVVIGRAGAAWGFEALGRRAATRVLSQLRTDLVRTRLRDHPASLDGAESAELASTAVAGVDALETAFGRYLPQVVLAIVVPIAVLVLVAVIDPISAGLMLLTLPLVPVFMWLIGRATEQRTRARWQALTLLSAHFLDVVQGLPTLRAFNRGEAQTVRIEAVSDDYRRTTMETLRLAFLSGAVLELAATLGVALIAVTAGVRLVDGSVAFVTALTVLLLAPELYLPVAQPRCPVPRQCRRARGDRSAARPDRRSAAGRPRQAPRRRARARRSCGSRASGSPTRRDPTGPRIGRPRPRPR